MTTRISKISRLPKPIRDELNSRLQNGQMAKTIEQWLNDQPETKATMTEHFASRTITHQNISDWRRTGYQDWLQHQERIAWLDRFSEQDVELKKHDRTADDSFEALGRIFVVEIGQGLAALQQIRNPHDRSAQMQTLAREFARVQNAYNRSRRTQLEFDKHNREIRQNRAAEPETVEPLDPRPSTLNPPKPQLNTVFKWLYHTRCYRNCVCKKCHPEDGNYPYTQAVKDDAAKSVPFEYWTHGNEHWHIIRADCHCTCDSEKCAELERTYATSPASPPSTPDPLSAEASAKADRPCTSLPINECQPNPAPASPTPNSNPPSSILHSHSPKLAAPAPTPQPPIRRPNYYDPRPPIRGRRFRCIEG